MRTTCNDKYSEDMLDVDCL